MADTSPNDNAAAPPTTLPPPNIARQAPVEGRPQGAVSLNLLGTAAFASAARTLCVSFFCVGSRQRSVFSHPWHPFRPLVGTPQEAFVLGALAQAGGKELCRAENGPSNEIVEVR